MVSKKISFDFVKKLDSDPDPIRNRILLKSDPDPEFTSKSDLEIIFSDPTHCHLEVKENRYFFLIEIFLSCFPFLPDFIIRESGSAAFPLTYQDDEFAMHHDPDLVVILLCLLLPAVSKRHVKEEASSGPDTKARDSCPLPFARQDCSATTLPHSPPPMWSSSQVRPGCWIWVRSDL